MDAGRTAIACFAGCLLVTVGGRAWYAAALAHGERVLYGGILLGSLLWILGVYHGYRALRSE